MWSWKASRGRIEIQINIFPPTYSSCVFFTHPWAQIEPLWWFSSLQEISSFNNIFRRFFSELSAMVGQCSLTIIFIRHPVTAIVNCHAIVIMICLTIPMTNTCNRTNTVIVLFLKCRVIAKIQKLTYTV